MLKPEQFKHLSTYLIAKEAENRGVKVKKMVTKGVYADGSLLEFRLGDRVEYMVGQRTSKTDSVAYWLQKNKYYAKIFLKNAGLSVSPGEIFKARDLSGMSEYAKKIGFPIVVKKTNGTHGSQVYVDIRNKKTLLETAQNFSGNFLIEKMFVGIEYRMFVTRHRFVAATQRIPANVIGDGISTIERLVEIKNDDPRRSDGYSTGLMNLKLDDYTDNVLLKQGLSTKSIPKMGQPVLLRDNSNISTGGDSIDVTDIVHPDIKKIAIQAVRAIPGLAYGGVDFLTNKSITEKPNKKSYVIIEINDSPMISMHHYPYVGKPRDAASAIVDTLFPETKVKA